MGPPRLHEHPPSFLRQLFDAAVCAAMPADVIAAAVASERALAPSLQPYLLAVGKAAIPMARAALSVLPSDTRGRIVTAYGHGDADWTPPPSIQVVEAAHPVPDTHSVAAGRRLLADMAALGSCHHVIALLSGGGSALLAVPAKHIALAEKQRISADLLACGAPIEDINLVRKHLSAIKGGKLAIAAWPARVSTLVISDIPGDDPRLVASGPTLPEHSLPADALAVLDRYGIDAPRALRAAAAQSSAALSTHPAFIDSPAPIICASVANVMTTIQCAAHISGLDVIMLGNRLSGDAALLAAEHAALVRRLDPTRPTLLLSGGETSVVVRNRSARGGRNGAYLLALALELDGAPDIYAIACDTDGIDGNGDNAGGIIAPDSLSRVRAAGLEPLQLQAEDRSYDFLVAAGGLVVTGPTRTNVNDFRAILVQPRGSAGRSEAKHGSV
jgi:hydroxypyruvate reductase